MDKKKLISLSQKDIRDVESYVWSMIDRRRGFLSLENPISYFVSICYLAEVTREINDLQSSLNSNEALIADDVTLSFLKTVYNEFGEGICDLSKRFDSDTIQAAILFAGPQRFSEINEHSTPEGVSRLAASLLRINEDDTVLDFGSGVGSFLFHVATDTPCCKKLYGVELNTSNVIVSTIRSLLLARPVQIKQGNVLSQEFYDLGASKVFSNPPLGMRLTYLYEYIAKNPKLEKYFKNAKRTVSGDWAYALAAYLNMTQPGKTVVIMTNAGTWNKPDEYIRKKLLEDGVIEGVISLPVNLLTTTNIPLTMIILSQNNTEVRMVDASAIFTEGRRQNTLEETDVQRILDAYYNSKRHISTAVNIAEIAEQEYILNPQRYLKAPISINNGIQLGDVCLSINRGAMIRSADLDQMATSEETKFRYLMLQNINDGITDSNLPYLKNIDTKYRKYCIKNRNLIISKNAPFKIALAQVRSGELILANGNLYLIELDEEQVNPIYVQLFLQSEIGIAQLNRYAKGSSIRSISIQDLRLISIPKLTKEQQDEIARKFEDLQDELKVLQRQEDLVRDKMIKLLEGVI